MDNLLQKQLISFKQLNKGWKATAIGKNYKNAKTFLEKRYNPDRSIQDAIHDALLTLKEGYQGKQDSRN